VVGTPAEWLASRSAVVFAIARVHCLQRHRDGITDTKDSKTYHLAPELPVRRTVGIAPRWSRSLSTRKDQ
jgi:hypothetical protein